MRSVLIDAHRARATDKRGSGLAPLTLNTSALGRIQPVEDFTRDSSVRLHQRKCNQRFHFFRCQPWRFRHNDHARTVQVREDINL